MGKEAKLQEFKFLLGEITDLTGAAALLDWDQQTYMPRRSGCAR